jgi:hypothetical protein
MRSQFKLLHHLLAPKTAWIDGHSPERSLLSLVAHICSRLLRTPLGLGPLLSDRIIVVQHSAAAQSRHQVDMAAFSQPVLQSLVSFVVDRKAQTHMCQCVLILHIFATINESLVRYRYIDPLVYEVFQAVDSQGLLDFESRFLSSQLPHNYLECPSWIALALNAWQLICSRDCPM